MKERPNINGSYIEIRVKGQYNGQELTPANYDITEVRDTLSVALKLLTPLRGEEPISYVIDEGSVRNRFAVIKQTAIVATSLFSLIASDYLLSEVENNTANAIEELQKISYKNGYTYELYTSEDTKNRLVISPTTRFKRQEAKTIDGDFYLYGTLTRAGGTSTPTIQLSTDKYGKLLIKTTQQTLQKLEKNPLYHTCGVYAKGLYDVSTNEIIKDSLTLVEIIDYSMEYNPQYLQKKIEMATPIWSDVDADMWLNEIRGRV